MKKIKILVIDDDKYFKLAIKPIVEKFGLIEEASNAAEAITLINNNHYDLALIDMQIETDRDGLEILKLTNQKSIKSLILSSYDDPETIKEAYQNGCKHFLAKLNYTKNLEAYLKTVIKEISKPKNKLEYITKDSKLLEQISKLENTNLMGQNIFLTGETGVGKSLIAKYLHLTCYDNKQNFIHLNCSSISENLLESELFGHKKGAFTGAANDQVGKLELANEGTLFLDEIATMPMSMQQKLLKAIDDKEFYPVGSTKPVKSNFTLISATCEDLFQLISEGKFRKDLFFRISGFNIDIPPLRQRPYDIRPLIEYFVKIASRRVFIEECAFKTLESYKWPGNIRELKKAIDMLCLNTSGIITKTHVQNIFEQSKDSFLDENLLTHTQKNFIKDNGLREFIKSIEKQVVKEILELNKGKVSHTIKELKISASAFYRIFDNLQT
ncbi:MAG: sigma-54 dependent transcriptional regulator [Bacteriovoracaceae bacterium]|jgi:DNA-binding NtrC family response regulator|nr:sigma-54 dependent transcriptional regulator [Bacteriovoracaceae bacterium]